MFIQQDKHPLNHYHPIVTNVVDFVRQVATTIIGGNPFVAPLLGENLVDVLIIHDVSLFTQKEALHFYRLEQLRRFNSFAEIIYDKNERISLKDY
ncbi:hypothetical protein [Streptococcus porci]|uniref:hypothetical protein n=1 Tax=Streptococcus porci TaxID=502567 RepID=UPI000683ECD2|nr:hypothetical protein [Streptococcus porci]